MDDEAFAKQTVLVTGAQGFVGSWMAETLLDAGATVVVPRRDLPAGSRFDTEGIADRCELVMLDLEDYPAVSRVVNEYEVDSVFHLAAQTLVGVANRSPLSTWESNIRATYTILEACRVAATTSSPPGRIVVASSDKAYGAHDELPYREDFPLQPTYPYDVSKACTDMIARSYATTYGMPVAVTRFANIYGGGDLNWSRIVPDSARALVNGEAPVIRSDGTPERDYLYVADAVSAYLAVALSLDREDMHGRAWNAGWNEAVPVLDLVRRLIDLSGRDVDPDVRGTGNPAGEIDRQVLDATAIRQELGWEPTWDLDRGLRATWDWYERRLAED